ncbi:deoxyribodipyrimidine photo-lyase, partial [Phenoliferia sp. Uapishka_3]
MPPKRPASSSSSASSAKKVKAEVKEDVNKLPDLMEDTPLAKLFEAQKELAKTKAPVVEEGKDGVVVYWMRNKDLRLRDNRALALASEYASSLSLPLIILHIFSPSDYAAHDRSPRRIDFHLRALRLIQTAAAKLDIPLFSVTWSDRTEIEGNLAHLLGEWKATHLVANLEYEVDELRRDEKILRGVMKARKEGEGWKGEAHFVADFCVVNPGLVLTQQGKPYSVFSPWYKNWAASVAKDLQGTLGDAGGAVQNHKDARTHAVLQPIFEHKLPSHIEGYKLEEEDQKTMEHLWPAGQDICDQVMHRFLKTKMRPQAFQEPPLHPGAEEVALKASKIGVYGTGRNAVDMDGTSHISAYLATGMISPRECLRATMKLTGGKLDTDKSGGGVGVWVSEVAWRDFYQHVLCAWPRVCMGRPFNLKFDDIVWQQSDEHLQAWKDGKTGFPIVDAAMRALKAQGYMHNRCRMITAMFLTKDLLLDWRLGEKWFMQNLIDGDLGSNNGGWQWSASVGTDPQPYFRVFNPTSQSEKSDTSGDYIRHWVPELKHLKGKAIHDPSAKLSKKELAKIGYPSPIVDHAKSRIRAIARYKNPGDDVDE